MAHTAGPGASVASVVVDLWNWVSAHAARYNDGKDKAFDQLSPSLRRFITSTDEQMHDRVDAQIAWRLPVAFDVEALSDEIRNWPATHASGAKATFDFRFRGYRAPVVKALPTPDCSASSWLWLHPIPGWRIWILSGDNGTSDMNVVAPLWHCPIVAYGPGDSALDHTPTEHLPLDEYWRAVNVIDHALRAFASA